MAIFIRGSVPLDKLLSLGKDGLNVNKTIINKLQQLLKEDISLASFADFDSCPLHITYCLL